MRNIASGGGGFYRFKKQKKNPTDKQVIARSPRERLSNYGNVRGRGSNFYYTHRKSGI